MHPNRPIAVDPIWQSSAVVYLLIALNTIAIAAKGLDIPNETGAALANRLDMIWANFIKREFLITSEAMEIVELAKVAPFGGGVRAARLGFAGAANITFFPLSLLAFFGLLVLLLVLLALFRLLVLSLGLLAFFGLKISAASLFVFVRLPVLSLRLLAFFGLPVLSLDLLAFFGLLVLLPILALILLALFRLLVLLVLFGLMILPKAYFALTLESISFALVPRKSLSRFDLAALTTSLHHFVVSLFFRYLNYTTSRGET